MAKKPRHVCSRCTEKVGEGNAFCKACGYPTQWASHDEKVEWELAQYERARLDGTHTDFDRIQTAPPPTRRASERKAPSPARAVHEPVVSVREFREQRAGDVAVVRRDEPAVAAKKQAPSVPPVPEASESAVLVKVMRLLNARITELEGRIAELEGSQAPQRRASEGR